MPPARVVERKVQAAQRDGRIHARLDLGLVGRVGFEECAPRSVRPSRDNFCGELRPRRRRRLSARLMRILSGEPTPAEQLATYNDTRQIFAD